MPVAHEKDMRYYVRQADVALNQANPVSGLEYAVLPETTFVRVYSIFSEITGGTVQNLQDHVTLDGNNIIHNQTPPVLGTPYYAEVQPMNNAANQNMTAAVGEALRRAFLHEGTVVDITVEATWTVQPTPLEANIKWSRYI